MGACVVSHTNLHAIYRPSESGSIISIDFDCSLRNIERSTETHFALLLEQNNNLYVSKNTVTAKRERWSTFRYDYTPLTSTYHELTFAEVCIISSEQTSDGLHQHQQRM